MQRLPAMSRLLAWRRAPAATLSSDKTSREDDEPLRPPQRFQPAFLDAEHKVVGSNREQRPSAGIVPRTRVDAIVVERWLAAGSNGDNEIALPVSASFQLEPDRHGSVVKLSGCVGPARKEAEWPALDRGLCQQAREAWQELLPWSDELPGDHDDDEEQQKGERDPSPPESRFGVEGYPPTGPTPSVGFRNRR